MEVPPAMIPCRPHAGGPRPLWSGSTSLNEYVQREWAGLLSDYYGPRWKLFTDMLVESVRAGSAFEEDAYFKRVRAFENEWVNGSETYKDAPNGNPAAVALEMFHRYRRYVDCE